MYKRVVSLCKAYNLSVRKLEEALGLSNGAIRHWKKVYPTVENLIKVANYFGVSTDYLIYGRKALDEQKGD